LKILACDIETKSVADKPDPYQDTILLTSVVWDDGREYVFDRLEYPDWFIAALEDSNVLKLVHNASFEWKFFMHNLGINMVNVWDTLAVERVLTSGKGMSCSLESVAGRRLNKKLDKSIRERFKSGLVGEEEQEYCLEDSRVLFPIYQQQLRAVTETGQLFAAELESKISIIVGSMELHGIGFDIDLWGSYIPLIQTRITEAERFVWDFLEIRYCEDLFSGVGGGIPLTCRDKILGALKKKGLYLKDYQAHTLQEALFKSKHPEVVQSLLDFKKWNKALTWNYPQFINPVTGRIHASFHATGTDTGRFSSSKPNLQQISKPFEKDNINFRHLFTASEGRKIIGADYSQIELRLLAHESGEEHYIESYSSGRDLHRYVAESVLGRKLKDKEERNLGKAVNFGIAAYGGSVPALRGSALEYGILLTEAEAKQYIRKVRKTNAKVELWGKRMHNLMRSQGWMQTPIGHRRYLVEEDRETVARNTPISGLAAGIMKVALVKIYDSLKEYDADIVWQVHDEIGVDCAEEQVAEVEPIIKRDMIAAWDAWIDDVPIEVDSYVSDTGEK